MPSRAPKQSAMRSAARSWASVWEAPRLARTAVSQPVISSLRILVLAATSPARAASARAMSSSCAICCQTLKDRAGNQGWEWWKKKWGGFGVLGGLRIRLVGLAEVDKGRAVGYGVAGAGCDSGRSA